MHSVTPEVHIIAETKINYANLTRYLETIGAPDWQTDAESNVEEIVEVMSRSCYKSFGTELNPNITRTREGNQPHLANILASGHGSVMEHAWVSFMFTNVSRVFTHELVRHRPGVAISQESLRFVRLDDLGCWIPPCFADDPRAVDAFECAFHEAENYYSALLSLAAQKEGVDSFDDLPFSKKKLYTSAARRVAPIGLATNIGWSCNIRTLRHVLTMRTDPSAEEEIRLVFSQVGALVLPRYPNLFADFHVEQRDGEPDQYVPAHVKI